MKLMASPFCAKGDFLLIMINNEASYSINSSIVSRDENEGSMRKSKSIIRIIRVAAGNNFQISALISYITDVYRINLSYSGY